MLDKNDIVNTKNYQKGSGMVTIYFCQQLLTGTAAVKEGDSSLCRYLSEKVERKGIIKP